MKANKQKELLARTLKVGKKRIKLNPEKSDLIVEAITRQDLRKVIGEAIIVKGKVGPSRGRINERKKAQKKGRQKGAGHKKGAKYSRISKKELWMNKVRVQRKFLKELKLKEILDNKLYRKLYRMITGGFFRSKAHLKLYITKIKTELKQDGNRT